MLYCPMLYYTTLHTIIEGNTLIVYRHGHPGCPPGARGGNAIRGVPGRAMAPLLPAY